MTPLQTKRLTVSLSFFLFVLLCFSWTSCDRPGAPQQAERDSSGMDTLQNTLDSTHAKPLIDYYEGVNGPVNADFFFGGQERQDEKVVTFHLNDKQTQAFFNELDSLKNFSEPGDSIEIRIQMAFHGQEGQKLPGRTNVAPLLELVVEKKGNTSGRFYPLRSEKTVSQRIVSDSVANQLIQNWVNTPVDSVSNQLFYEDKTTERKDRLKYYTFDAQDTEDIYQYWKAGKEKLYFYVHLGQLKEVDYVPLRTIIHLSRTPLEEMERSAAMDGDGEEFEFSKPCPTYCNE